MCFLLGVCACASLQAYVCVVGDFLAMECLSNLIRGEIKARLCFGFATLLFRPRCLPDAI